MPASFRPNLLATLALATTVSMTGCIFPFTRSSDTKLAEIVHEDTQPQPQQNVAAAPPKREGEKQMPPFARFLGGMFGGGEKSPTEPATQPTTMNASPPAERVAEVPARKPAATPSTIQPAQDLVEAPPQTTDLNSPSNRSSMPVVVTPETNRMADKPDVVSKFTQKASQLVASPRPEVVIDSKPQPKPQPQATTEVTPAPQVANTPSIKPGDEALDAHARTPWGDRKLLKQAMANSSSRTTTLEHSLQLALETVRQERIGQDQAAAPHLMASQSTESQSTAPPPEVTAQAETEEKPSLPAQAEPTPDSTKVAANPLRTSRTKTDWSGSSLRENEPQTVVNNTFSKYPKTDSKWAPMLSSGQAAPEEVTRQAEPTAEPQLTVNPYADSTEDTPPAQPAAGPQLVHNTTLEDKAAEEKPNTTDDIHFQSSLLSKLQAANRQAKWDFDSQPEPAEPNAQATEVLESSLPQIVDQDAADPELPLVAAEAPEPSTPEPKTTVNPSVAQREEEPQEIKPFIIAEPERPAPVRRSLIRAVEPQPLVMENQDGDWRRALPADAKQLPKLAPVVRASEYQNPSPQGGGSKTYIVN